MPMTTSSIASASSVFKDSKRSRDSDTMSIKSSKSSKSEGGDKKKLSALEEIRLDEERKKQWKIKKEEDAMNKKIWVTEVSNFNFKNELIILKFCTNWN